MHDSMILDASPAQILGPVVESIFSALAKDIFDSDDPQFVLDLEGPRVPIGRLKELDPAPLHQSLDTNLGWHSTANLHVFGMATPCLTLDGDTGDYWSLVLTALLVADNGAKKDLARLEGRLRGLPGAMTYRIGEDGTSPFRLDDASRSRLSGSTMYRFREERQDWIDRQRATDRLYFRTFVGHCF